MRGDQLARQWRVIQAIEASSNGLTVAEIANREETGIRTIYRDLEALHSHGHAKALSSPRELFRPLLPFLDSFLTLSRSIRKTRKIFSTFLPLRSLRLGVRCSHQEAKYWRTEVMDARLRSQNVTLKRGQHMKYRPHAFTEHGILMLSSVLNSERAIRVNIAIMRAFVRLRKILASHADLAHKLEELEKKYDSQFKVVFDAIRQLMAPREGQRKKIGFQLKEKRASYGRR